MHIPFLPAVIAAFTLANGAHYWHQQLKPFTDKATQLQSFKETLLEGPFTAHWSSETKARAKNDPAFLQFTTEDGTEDGIEYHVGKAFDVEKLTDAAIFLKLPPNSPLLKARNKREMEAAHNTLAVILAHEGAHVAQGGFNIDVTNGKLLDPHYLIAAWRDLNLGKPMVKIPQFYKTKKLNFEYDEPQNGKFLITQGIAMPTHLTKNNSFMKAYQELHQSIDDYEKCRIDHEKSPESKQLLALNLKKIIVACFGVSKELEIDADKHGFEAVVVDTSLSSIQKIQAFTYAQEDCKRLEDSGLTHPLPTERISMINRYIQHIRMESINDTIRDEIAWQ